MSGRGAPMKYEHTRAAHSVAVDRAIVVIDLLRSGSLELAAGHHQASGEENRRGEICPYLMRFHQWSAHQEQPQQNDYNQMPDNNYGAPSKDMKMSPR